MMASKAIDDVDVAKFALMVTCKFELHQIDKILTEQGINMSHLNITLVMNSKNE